jgi:hypothetical protein
LGRYFTAVVSYVVPAEVVPDDEQNVLLFFGIAGLG